MSLWWKHLNFRAPQKLTLMATLEQVKELIVKEITPLKLKINVLTGKFEELSKTVKFLSEKYDDLLTQIQTSNGAVKRHAADLSGIKQDLKIIDKRAVEALDEVDELAQYVRRDCLEISGVKATDESTSESVVQAVGQAIGTPLTTDDISIAHPIPSYKTSAPPKIIVKFTRRKTRNKVYENRRKLYKKRAMDLPGLETNSGSQVFITESLTPKRKKFFGEINKVKKSLRWKYIWTYNGRIFIKEKENSKSYSFGNEEDLAKFEDANVPFKNRRDQQR